MRITIYDEFNIKNIDKKIELESYNMVFFQLHPPTKSPKKVKNYIVMLTNLSKIWGKIRFGHVTCASPSYGL